MTGEGRREERPLDVPPAEGWFWPDQEPLNRARVPRGVALRPQGDLPVIVRLVWSTGAEWVPGRAIRWTDGRVLVIVKPPYAPTNARELLCWLDVADVFRTIPRRRPPAAS